MKLNAKVTALRTNGRMELTVVTSASGLEQCITADNPDGYTLDESLVVLVFNKFSANRLFKDLETHRDGTGLLTSLETLADQLRPDEPPPFMAADTAGSVTTQEFAREVGRS